MVWNFLSLHIYLNHSQYLGLESIALLYSTQTYVHEYMNNNVHEYTNDMYMNIWLICTWIYEWYVNEYMNDMYINIRMICTWIYDWYVHEYMNDLFK